MINLKNGKNDKPNTDRDKKKETHNPKEALLTLAKELGKEPGLKDSF